MELVKKGDKIVWTSAKKVKSLVKRLPLNVILYGPPGTGKTYITAERATEILGITKTADEAWAEISRRLQEKDEAKRCVEFITFHQSYGYEEFVEGLWPVLAPGGTGDEERGNGVENSTQREEKETASHDSGGAANTKKGQVAYTIRHGVLKRIARRARNAWKDAGSPKNGTGTPAYVLIIDEINRGNISRIFGELITLVEDDKRLGADHEIQVTLPYSHELFGLPPNLYIIGTMNTADRSIALVDLALRRRFRFEEMEPDLKTLDSKTDVEGVDVQRLLEAMNKRIELLCDREHRIGHAYLMKCCNAGELVDAMLGKILPLLQEYFFDDWRKIDWVLGGGGKGKDGTSPFLEVEVLDVRKAFPLSKEARSEFDERERVSFRVRKAGELEKQQGGFVGALQPIYSAVASESD